MFLGNSHPELVLGSDLYFVRFVLSGLCIHSVFLHIIYQNNVGFFRDIEVTSSSEAYREVHWPFLDTACKDQQAYSK